MRSVLLCSALAFLLAAHSAEAQTKRAKPAAAAKQTAPVDTRPRFKRDDTPAPVVATPSTQSAGTKKRSARRKPVATRQAAETATPGAKASPRDIAACAQDRAPDLAIEGCTRMIEDAKQKPKARAVAYFNRGNAYVSRGEHDKAIADFDEALKIEPKNASIYNNRGNAHNDKGDSEAALVDFDAAIKHNARYAAAYFNRGNAFAAKGETERALRDYDAAIKLNKRNVNAHIARGALLLAGNASAKARANMAQAMRLAPKNAYAVLWADIAERRAKQKGRLITKNGLKGLDMKAWPAPVVRLYAGEIKPDAVLAAADDPSPTLKAAQTCEANFYSGEYALIGGSRDEAVKLFRAAAKDCPRGFLEGIAAAAELKGMGEKVSAN